MSLSDIGVQTICEVNFFRKWWQFARNLAAFPIKEAAICPVTGGFSSKLVANLYEIVVWLKPASGGIAGIEPNEGKNVGKNRAGKRRGGCGVGIVGDVSGGVRVCWGWAGGFMIAAVGGEVSCLLVLG